jgi:hypothetical protein
MSRVLSNAKVNSAGEMQQRNTVSIATVLPEMLIQVWAELEYHLDTNIFVNDAHVELY